MNDYTKSKIYRITDMGYNDLYIGSTTQTLANRLAGFKRMYKNNKYSKECDCLNVFDLFDKYGINGCKILLIGGYPCDGKHQLDLREEHQIRTTDCINKLRRPTHQQP